jgi:hypothetical protein
MSLRAAVIAAVTALAVTGALGAPTSTPAAASPTLVPVVSIAEDTDGAALSGAAAAQDKDPAPKKAKKASKKAKANDEKSKGKAHKKPKKSKSKKKKRKSKSRTRPKPTLATPLTPKPASVTLSSPSDFAFLMTNVDGTPARWNPCLPIGWRFNPLYASGTALADITAALAIVSAASGQTFTYTGTTADRPFKDGDSHPDGENLLIGFGTPQEYPSELGTTNIGYGGPWSGAWTDPIGNSVNGTRSPYEIVSGDVVLSTTHGLTRGFTNGASFGNLLLHELGHAMGMAHVNAPDEVMYRSLSQQSPGGFGRGDLAGLGKLGASGGCFTNPIR